MNHDGEIKPHVVVIRIPSRVLRDLENQYARTGYLQTTDETGARQAALSHMYRTVQKYLAAGTPYILMDENGIKYPVPFGDEVWSL